jgi:hypothetical protein
MTFLRAEHRSAYEWHPAIGQRAEPKASAQAAVVVIGGRELNLGGAVCGSLDGKGARRPRRRQTCFSTAITFSHPTETSFAQPMNWMIRLNSIVGIRAE